MANRARRPTRLSSGVSHLALLSLSMLQLLPRPLAASDPHAPDTPEPGSAEAIARLTTEPQFVSPGFFVKSPIPSQFCPTALPLRIRLMLTTVLFPF